MRHYSPDSPEATARVLALALLADGAIDLKEWKVLDHHFLAGDFGLDTKLFDTVIKDFCFDLAQYSDRDYVTHLEIDRETIASLLRDIRDPSSQMRLLRVIVDVVNADGALASGEAVLVAEAMLVWGLDLHQVTMKGKHPVPRKFDRRMNDRRTKVSQRAAA